MDFSYSVFLNNPFSSLCFFALIMTILSFWVRRTPWLWGPFLLIACVLAFEAKIVTPMAVIPVAALFFCDWILKNEVRNAGRLLLFALATVISLALSFHLMPGFHNWHLTSITLGEGYPYNLWLNFDKPFIGIIPLALMIPLIQSKAQLRKVVIMTLPLTAIGIAALMFVSLQTGMVKWDPKIPSFFFIWFIDNLFFVTIPEEVFFRGFFQTEVRKWLGNGLWAKVGAVFATSLGFTLIHVIWVPSIPFLCLVFLAGIIFGTIYEITQAIESSIFCHFTLNLLHILFFTYPALKT